jgi:hypothetical protein
MANVVKIVKGAVKAATKSKKPSLKAAQKAKPLAKPKSAVKVIKAGTKPLTTPKVPYSIKALRSPDQLKRMGK